MFWRSRENCPQFAATVNAKKGRIAGTARLTADARPVGTSASVGHASSWGVRTRSVALTVAAETAEYANNTIYALEECAYTRQSVATRRATPGRPVKTARTTAAARSVVRSASMQHASSRRVPARNVDPTAVMGLVVQVHARDRISASVVPAYVSPNARAGNVDPTVVEESAGYVHNITCVTPKEYVITTHPVETIRATRVRLVRTARKTVAAVFAARRAWMQRASSLRVPARNVDPMGAVGLVVQVHARDRISASVVPACVKPIA